MWTYSVQIPDLLFQRRKQVEGNQFGGTLSFLWGDLGANFSCEELSIRVRREVAGCRGAGKRKLN